MKKKQYSDEAKELCRKEGFDPFEVVDKLDDTVRGEAALGVAAYDDGVVLGFVGI